MLLNPVYPACLHVCMSYISLKCPELEAPPIGNPTARTPTVTGMDPRSGIPTLSRGSGFQDTMERAVEGSEESERVLKEVKFHKLKGVSRVPEEHFARDAVFVTLSFSNDSGFTVRPRIHDLGQWEEWYSINYKLLNYIYIKYLLLYNIYIIIIIIILMLVFEFEKQKIMIY